MTTTTTTEPGHRSGRLSTTRAALVVALAIVVAVTAGCTTAQDADPLDAASPTTVVTSNPPTTGQTASTTTTSVPIDAAALLQTALGAYDGGYAFAATATVASQEAAAISGFVIGDSSQMTVVSGDGVADYVTTPEGAWIRVEGGDWQELETSGPFDPPLASLASPTAITVTGATGDEVHVVATYPGAAFGLGSDVQMRMRFVGGILAEAGYAAGDASVTTVFTPLTDQVIESPSAGT